MKKRWSRLLGFVISIMMLLGLGIGSGALEDVGGPSLGVEDMEFTVVSYNANGGAGSVDSLIFDMFDFYECEKISITLHDGSAFTREGYQFVGWSTSKEAVTAEYQAGASYTVTQEDVTFYAVWLKVEPETFYGDIDGNEKVTFGDSVIFQQYFAGHSVTISEKWADLNGDNKITRADAMILARYFSRWEGYTTLPYLSPALES